MATRPIRASFWMLTLFLLLIWAEVFLVCLQKVFCDLHPSSSLFNNIHAYGWTNSCVFFSFSSLIKEKKIFVRSVKSKLKNLNVFNAFFIGKILRKILQLILLILQHIFAVTVVVNKSKTHLHRKWIQKKERIFHLIILFNDLMIITIIFVTLDGMLCKTTRNSHIRFIFFNTVTDY